MPFSMVCCEMFGGHLAYVIFGLKIKGIDFPPFYFKIILSITRYNNNHLNIVGVRFHSSTNECAMRSSEELKPRNIFNGIVMPLISLGKGISKQHVLPKDWEGWHRCGTCQINSDDEVSNGVIKVVFQW